MEVIIAGNARQLSSALDKAKKDTTGFARGLNIASKAAVGGLVLLGAGLVSSAKAAMSAQEGQASLDSTLRRTHQSVSAMRPALEAAMSAGRNLGFASDDSRLALARLEIATGSTKTAVKDLSIAEDISRVKHIDLVSASTMLAQSMTGSQRAAKQLGIIVIPVTKNMDALKKAHKELKTPITAVELAHAKLADKMATGAAVVAAVTDKVKGQAKAFAGTAAGSMAKFSAQTEQLKEKLGQALLPAIAALSTKLAEAAGWMTKHTTFVKIAAVAIGALSVVILAVKAAMAGWNAITAVGNAIRAIFITEMAVMGPLTEAQAVAQTTLNTAMRANVIGIVVTALAALAVGLVYAWKHSETFRNVVKGAFHVVAAAASAVASAAQAVWTWLGNLVNSKAVKVLGAVIAAPFLAAIGAISAVAGAIQHVIDLAGRAVSAIKGAFTGGTNAAATRGGGPSTVGGSSIRPVAGVHRGNELIIAEAGWLQTQLDALNATRAAKDLAQQVAAGNRAVAAAKKSGKGLVDAQKSLQDALFARTVAGVEARIKKEEDGLAKLSTAFDAFKSKALAAFDAITAGFSASTDPQLAAIALRRQTEDQAQAVTDAQKALADAQAGGDPDAIAAATRALFRAQEDIRITSLQKQSTDEHTAWDASRAALHDKLEADLTILGDHLQKVGAKMGSATEKIGSILAGAGLTFKGIGDTLGSSFVDGLKASIQGVNISAGQVFTTLRVNAKKIKKLAAGGIVTRPTLALIGEAGPEAVVPLSKARSGGGGGGDVYNISFPNYVGNERDLEAAMAKIVVRRGRRMGSAFGGLA